MAKVENYIRCYDKYLLFILNTALGEQEVSERDDWSL